MSTKTKMTPSFARFFLNALKEVAEEGDGAPDHSPIAAFDISICFHENDLPRPWLRPRHNDHDCPGDRIFDFDDTF